MRRWDVVDGGGAVWVRCDGKMIADVMPEDPDPGYDVDLALEFAKFIVNACNLAEWFKKLAEADGR